MKILIAEDDKNLLHALQTLFRKNQFTVDGVDNGGDALEYLRIGAYDAAVLDVMMPKLSGMEVVRALRAERNNTPILLLTAKSQIDDRVEGLDAGANDYLSKPFDIRELLARVRVLTRPAAQQSAVLEAGNLRLDTARFTLEGPNGCQALANKEYQTLLLLFHNLGTPVAPDRILQAVWEPDSQGQENALWTVMYNLRKKLEAVGADAFIRNKRNLGYVLEVAK